MRQIPHITVCVCTYKRPELLRRLLTDLVRQETGGVFTYSVVIVDNDATRSAESVTAEMARSTEIPIRYCVESKQNIALARNKAIQNTSGEFVAFIDDDEFPISQWLLTLYNALHQYNSDGALGPVKPHFDRDAPRWVIDAGFYDRPSYPTGFVIDWRKGRTGNVLLKRSLFDGDSQPFRPEFRTGEDQDLFRRLIEKGHVFIWCHEAMAYEVVPPVRWKLSFMLKRALLRGEVARRHPTFGVREVASSVLAVPAYTAALPFALALGTGKFMLLLVKIFDHMGRLLSLMGMNPVKEPYVTE